MRQFPPVLLVVLAALPMLLGALTLEPTRFFAGDAGPKYLQIQAFAHPGPWPRTIPYPAREIDPTLRFLPVSMAAVNGHVVSFFPFLFSLLASFGFSLMGSRIMLVLPALAALTAAWLAGLLVRRMGGEDDTVLPAMALVLATTPLMFYGACLWEHTLLTVTVLGAVWAILEALERPRFSPWLWLAAGGFAGISGWIRTEGFVFLALAAVPLVWQRGRRGLGASIFTAAGGLIGVLTGAAVQRWSLGTWLPVHLVACVNARGVYRPPFLETRLQTIRNLFVPNAWCGIALAVWLAALIATIRYPRQQTSRILGLGAIAAGLVAALGAPAVRFLMGASPADAFPVRSATAVWVVLSALPLALSLTPPVSRQRHMAASIVGAVAAGFVGVFVLLSPVDGGYQWGARIFLPTVVLLGALLAARLHTAWSSGTRLERSAVALAVLAGVVVQLLGMALLVHVTAGNAALQADLAARTTPQEVVVTDSFYIPELGAPLWQERRFLLIQSPADTHELLDRLRTLHVESWTFVSASDANAGMADSIGRLASDLGWSRASRSDSKLPGRQLTWIRFVRPKIAADPPPEAGPQGTRQTGSAS